VVRSSSPDPYDAPLTGVWRRQESRRSVSAYSAAGAHQHVEHLAGTVDDIVNITTTTPRLQLGPLYPWSQTVDA
jgi:hypothetical protein